LFGGGVKPEITHRFTHNIAVFLPDEAVIILAIRAAPCPGDMLPDAPVHEPHVDKLAAAMYGALSLSMP
jgi:hypothetical protein